jgi:hypothetical protein
MHKSATKCNETIGKWYKNKHGASKIIDTFETYQAPWCSRVGKPRFGGEVVLRGVGGHDNIEEGVVLELKNDGDTGASNLDGRGLSP